MYKYFTLLKLNKRSVEPKFIAAFSSRVIDYSTIKVVDKIAIEQRHRTILGSAFQDRVAVYVEDIHSSKPFTLVIFQNTPETAEWQDSTRIALDDFRKKVQKENIIFEGEIDPLKPEVNFSYQDQNYALFGTVRAKSSTDYFDFEVFRITK